MADAPEDSWEKTWDSRLGALEQRFGKSADHVYHGVLPFAFGGEADVVVFPAYQGGIAHVTAEMTGEEVGQVRGEFASYELMICTRTKNDKAADLISRLARSTCESRLLAGESMDIGDFFDDRSIRAILFCHPEEQPVVFEVNQRRCGILLCVGITKDELDLKMKQGSVVLLELLKAKGVFPFTDPNRTSLVSKPWYRPW